MTKIVKYDPSLSTLEAGPRMVRPTAKEKAAASRKRYSQKLRHEVFKHYCGGKEPHCQCPGCKVNYTEFLQLDHLNGDGAVHKKANKLGTGADQLWRWVRDHGYPPGFQVLCCNCNHAKGNKLAACPLAGKSHVPEER
jgi:transposase-like protein